MKIITRSLKFLNSLARNRVPPILFYISEKKEKLNPLDYQVYKLQTNPKDKKLVVYSLTLKFYEVIKGQNIQDSKAAYTLVKSLLRGDTLQVFQNEEANQEGRDGS
eukprot:1609877-Ditylum_brightwellii.AAC.1